MKGIYLASYTANHPSHDLVYQDILGHRDIGGDMMDVDLSEFDYIIATPPCNYWSRANYRRETSEYSQKTKHLLPDIIHKLIALGKPFLVENVRSPRLFQENGIWGIEGCHIYIIGRHTIWTNIEMKTDDIPQRQDFKAYYTEHGTRYQERVFYEDDKEYTDVKGTKHPKRQGGYNVHQIVERFIQTLEGREKLINGIKKIQNSSVYGMIGEDHGKEID